jgi:hypothetical protein
MCVCVRGGRGRGDEGLVRRALLQSRDKSDSPSKVFVKDVAKIPSRPGLSKDTAGVKRKGE